jgi:hypothetical protein
VKSRSVIGQIGLSHRALTALLSLWTSLCWIFLQSSPLSPEPYRNAIRKIPQEYADDPAAFLTQQNITAKKIIFTAAWSNLPIAKQQSHEQGLDVQHRPLLMGMLKPAPFPLFAHLVGTSEKPVATITTHKDRDGALIWYLGGGVAERSKESPPQDTFNAVKKAFSTYMPALDLSTVKWASLPIDRVEGKSKTDGWMPDTPTLHRAGNMRCTAWPTKLTFAPMLARIRCWTNWKRSKAF